MEEKHHQTGQGGTWNPGSSPRGRLAALSPDRRGGPAGKEKRRPCCQGRRGKWGVRCAASIRDSGRAADGSRAFHQGSAGKEKRRPCCQGRRASIKDCVKSCDGLDEGRKWLVQPTNQAGTVQTQPDRGGKRQNQPPRLDRQPAQPGVNLYVAARDEVVRESPFAPYPVGEC